MRWLLAIAFIVRIPLTAGTAADVARAIRENSFDPTECYRVRDLTITKEDLKIYLTDGYLIFSKPVDGRRIAAAFSTTDVDGGDGEVILLPPNRAERASLAAYTHSPNLDEHFRSALFVFTGNDYDQLLSQFPTNPANKKAPEAAALMDDAWTSALHSLGASFQTRLTLDLLGGPAARTGLFAALFSGVTLGNFDAIFDPFNPEQIVLGQVATRNERTYFDVWTSFQARSFRKRPPPRREDVLVSDYRIQATINPDLSLDAVTRVKVKPVIDGATAVTFEVAPQMSVTSATVDGRPAEVLQRDSVRENYAHSGNNLFLVFPPEPLRAGRAYEFEFHHSGKVIVDAGGRVFFVAARGNWYPAHTLQFANYDMQFRYPSGLDLVASGDVVEDRTEGDWRTTRFRTAAPIRFAAFNLGDYEQARVERGGYTVDVCANRSVESALQPKPAEIVVTPLPAGRPRRTTDLPQVTAALSTPPPDPLARLQSLASGVASAIEFMAARFGPPALPHITVSPIPGTFGQGFPGLIYISTLSYFQSLPAGHGPVGPAQQLYFDDLLQAHETAHQWWGNRITATSYRDGWLMEALANISALMYIEHRKGSQATDLLLDDYRNDLLEKGANGQTIESAGPIVFGPRLENSQQPSAYRTIIYGKGTWVLQMLRRRMGDERFVAMLAEILKRYDHRDISTEEFRELAARFVPPRSDDPQLENFFDEWVYATGIPSLKLAYSLKGRAPSLRLVLALTQSDVDDEFSTLVPVEIQLPHGPPVTQWIRSSDERVTVTVPLKQAPVKVLLDPHYAVLRR